MVNPIIETTLTESRPGCLSVCPYMIHIFWISFCLAIGFCWKFLVVFFQKLFSKTEGIRFWLQCICLNCRHIWVGLHILASRVDTQRQFWTATRLSAWSRTVLEHLYTEVHWSTRSMHSDWLWMTSVGQYHWTASVAWRTTTELCAIKLWITSSRSSAFFC